MSGSPHWSPRRKRDRGSPTGRRLRAVGWRLHDVVVEVLACRQDAGVEKPEAQRSGRVALTNSAPPPPWPTSGPSILWISPIRLARQTLRRRKVSSASSRNTPLRVVPRRPASTSTARSRSSGRDTITLAAPTVCPVMPVGTKDVRPAERGSAATSAKSPRCRAAPLVRRSHEGDDRSSQHRTPVLVVSPKVH
jgi:hypothetical protein